jgi:hypothetical protein
MENRLANASTGRLLSGLVSDVEDLVQEQFALFRAEIKKEAREARQALVPAFAGAGLLALGVFLLAFALVYVLNAATQLPLWGCFGIVAICLGIAGGIALAVGLQRLRQLTPVAEESVEELKENVRCLTK